MPIVAVEVSAVFDLRCERCKRTWRERMTETEACESSELAEFRASCEIGSTILFSKLFDRNPPSVCSTCKTWPSRIEAQRQPETK